MEDYLSIEESFAYALRRLELELDLLDRLFVVTRARGLQIHDERVVHVVERVEKRILAARTELSRFNRQHQHVGIGTLVDVTPDALASDLGDFGTELGDLEFAAQVMFPEPGNLGGKVFDRRFAHAQSLAQEGG